jgi:hypothetical protein
LAFFWGLIEVFYRKKTSTASLKDFLVKNHFPN